MNYFENTIITTTMYIIFDKTVNYFLKYNNQTTYYLIHFIFNFGITITCFDSVLYLITNFSKLENYSSRIVSSNILSFHIYHTLIYYKFFKFNDWLHHFFTYVCLINSFNYDNKEYGYDRAIYFFMTGLPGLLYYGPLFCLKNGWISKRTEISIQYYTNVYLRSVGINFAVWANILCYANGHYIIDEKYFHLFVFNNAMALANSQYFTSESTIAYAKHKLKI